MLDEVRKLNPVDPETGHRKDYHHQWFTEDVGRPKLRAHIEAVTALMRASANMSKFRANLQRAYPNKCDNFMLAFMDDDWRLTHRSDVRVKHLGRQPRSLLLTLQSRSWQNDVKYLFSGDPCRVSR